MGNAELKEAQQALETEKEARKQDKLEYEKEKKEETENTDKRETQTKQNEVEQKREEEIKEKENNDDKDSVRLTIIISFLSMISSLALSGTFGWDNTANGTIAVLMSIFSIAISSGKFYNNFKACKGIEEKINIGFEELKRHKFRTVEGYSKDINRYSKKIYTNNFRLMKSWAFFLSSLNDGTFDFFQGCGALLEENYSNTSGKLLLFASWFGVAEEIIESCIEVSPAIFESNIFAPFVHYAYLLWGIFESAIGIFILLKFDNSALIIIGVLSESIVILMILYKFIHFTITYFNNYQVTIKQLLIVCNVMVVVLGLFSSLLFMNVFNLNKKKNGKIILFMAFTTLFIHFLGLYLGFSQESDQWASIFSIIPALNVSLFRFLHGIGFILRLEYYSTESYVLLVCAVWIGFFVEVFYTIPAVLCSHDPFPLFEFVDECILNGNGDWGKLWDRNLFFVILNIIQVSLSIVLLNSLNDHDSRSFYNVSITIQISILIEIVLLFCCFGCFTAKLLAKCPKTKDIEQNNEAEDKLKRNINIELEIKKQKKQELFIPMQMNSGFGGGRWRTPVTSWSNAEGCFGGNGLVLMANGTRKKIRNLKVGDNVRCFPDVISQIECVIESNIYKKIEMVNLNNFVNDTHFWITFEHPIIALIGDHKYSNINGKNSKYSMIDCLDTNNINQYNLEWVLPTKIYSKRFRYVDTIFNFVLTSHHTLNVNGYYCCTLGHDFKGTIIEHSFWGDSRVINNFLKVNPTYPNVVWNDHDHEMIYDKLMKLD